MGLLKITHWLSQAFMSNKEKELDTLKEQADKLLTVEEACQLLRISRPTFDRMRNRQQIAVIKIGRKVRIKSDELRRVIESGTQ